MKEIKVGPYYRVWGHGYEGFSVCFGMFLKTIEQVETFVDHWLASGIYHSMTVELYDVEGAFVDSNKYFHAVESFDDCI